MCATTLKTTTTTTANRIKRKRFIGNGFRDCFAVLYEITTEMMDEDNDDAVTLNSTFNT